MEGIDHGFVAGLGFAAGDDSVEGALEEGGEGGGVEGGGGGDGLAAVAEDGAEDGAAGTAHGGDHGHAGVGEEFADAFGGVGGLDFFFDGAEAAGHADAVVTVAEVAVGFAEVGLCGDHGVGYGQQHGLDLRGRKGGDAHGQ